MTEDNSDSEKSLPPPETSTVPLPKINEVRRRKKPKRPSANRDPDFICHDEDEPDVDQDEYLPDSGSERDDAFTLAPLTGRKRPRAPSRRQAPADRARRGGRRPTVSRRSSELEEDLAPPRKRARRRSRVVSAADSSDDGLPYSLPGPEADLDISSSPFVVPHFACYIQRLLSKPENARGLTAKNIVTQLRRAVGAGPPLPEKDANGLEIRRRRIGRRKHTNLKMYFETLTLRSILGATYGVLTKLINAKKLAIVSTRGPRRFALFTKGLPLPHQPLARRTRSRRKRNPVRRKPTEMETKFTNQIFLVTARMLVRDIQIRLDSAIRPLQMGFESVGFHGSDSGLGGTVQPSTLLRARDKLLLDAWEHCFSCLLFFGFTVRLVYEFAIVQFTLSDFLIRTRGHPVLGGKKIIQRVYCQKLRVNARRGRTKANARKCIERIFNPFRGVFVVAGKAGVFDVLTREPNSVRDLLLRIKVELEKETSQFMTPVE